VLIGTQLAADGLEWLRATTTVAGTSDTITVPANYGIINVFVDTGGTTYRVKRASRASRAMAANITGNITIDYIPAATSITSDSATVTFLGVDLNNLVADQYCTYLACADLAGKEPDANPNIRGKLPELERAVIGAFIPAVSSPALYQSTSIYRDARYHISSPTTIKLFR
jgi:hypothetical protein